MKRQRNIAQNSRKRTKQNRHEQSSRCRFKILVVRMLNELSENLNSIKKESVGNKEYTN